MTASESEHVYLSLRDAKKSLNTKINLMAKVSEVGAVLKTRGSSYVLTLKLVDQFQSPPGIHINFFTENADKFPQVRSIGDIISLHQVEMKVNNGEFYCTFNSKISSFALYNEDAAFDLAPYQISMNHQAEDHDKKILLQFMAISQNHQRAQAYVGLVEPSARLICDIIEEEKLTIVCKVLHIHETSDDDWVLFVWDATDSPLVTLQMDLDMEVQAQTPLHPEASLLSREALCAFPLVGTIIRIDVTKQCDGICLLKGDYWFRFCNVVFELQSGLWKGALAPFSNIHVLCNEDDDVQRRQRIYKDRILSKVDRLPLSSFPQPSDVTETDFTYSSYSTLMESLAHSEIVHKCRTVVRVVASFPWRAKDLRSPGGSYRIRLTIEDSTARIHAFIFEEDGENFFDGYPPIDVLTGKMNSLLGIKDGSSSTTVCRNPPWVLCCLKSYYLDENDPWRSRRYRIFGTKLIG